MSEPFRISVASFGRVFDVTPQPDALTLEELAESLTRFQVKPELARREERELDRAKKAYEAHLAGTVSEGPMNKRFERHLHKHGGGADPAVMAAALADLEKDIRREAKQDFRLWAPALFAPGEKREDENVVHLSALVLDLDRGPSPEALRQAFADCFHIAHSTWSHSRAKTKLRFIVPFSAPVRPEDFHAVWFHADARLGQLADPTGRALARAWGLPAIPYPDRERLAWTHPGPLFDPFALGLAAAPETTPIPAPTHASFMRQDPAETYLPPNVPEPALVVSATPAYDPWDGGGAPRRPAPEATAGRALRPEKVPEASEGGPQGAAQASRGATDTAPAPTLEARVAALEARIAALEKLLSDYL